MLCAQKIEILPIEQAFHIAQNTLIKQIDYEYNLDFAGAVLEGFLRFPETTQNLSLDDGYAPFQLNKAYTAC